MKYVLLLSSPIYRWGNCGTERLSPRIGRGKVRVQSQSLTPGPCTWPPYCTALSHTHLRFRFPALHPSCPSETCVEEHVVIFMHLFLPHTCIRDRVVLLHFLSSPPPLVSLLGLPAFSLYPTHPPLNGHPRNEHALCCHPAPLAISLR